MASTQCRIIGTFTAWGDRFGRAGRLADQLRQLHTVVREGRQLLERVPPDPTGDRAHRAPRVMPRPAVATISRWTSLTPPPNVLTCAWRPVASSRPRSSAPGEPGSR